MDENKLFEWLDGELPDAEAAIIERLVAGDPQLSRLADEHRRLRSRLETAFDPVLQAPFPADIVASLESEQSPIVDLQAAREARMERRRQPSEWVRWTAVAASVGAAFYLGTITSGTVEGPVVIRDGATFAAPVIAQALDRQLASAQNGSPAVRLGLTFRNHEGDICRSFVTAGSSGLACLEAGGWALKGLFASAPAAAGDYRMASGMSPQLAGLVDEQIVGEPFDAAQERSAQRRGWR